MMMDIVAVLTALGLDTKTVVLVVAIATPLWALFKAVVPLIKDQKVQATAERVVRYVEQIGDGWSNATKKQTAVSMVQAKVPKLTDKAAVIAVESAVYELKAPVKAMAAMFEIPTDGAAKL